MVLQELKAQDCTSVGGWVADGGLPVTTPMFGDCSVARLNGSFSRIILRRRDHGEGGREARSNPPPPIAIEVCTSDQL